MNMLINIVFKPQFKVSLKLEVIKYFIYPKVI